MPCLFVCLWLFPAFRLRRSSWAVLIIALVVVPSFFLLWRRHVRLKPHDFEREMQDIFVNDQIDMAFSAPGQNALTAPAYTSTTSVEMRRQVTA